jgi:uncharacterized protein HemX
MNYSNNNNNSNIIDGNNITINEDAPRRSSSRKQCFCIRLLTNKYFLVPFILFILTLGMLIAVMIERNNHINNLKNNLQINQTFIAETENRNNQTVQQCNNVFSENNATIEQLNKTFVEIKHERSRINNHWKRIKIFHIFRYHFN